MANAVPRQRRKGFAALGISVLNSNDTQDQKDIKFRSHHRARDSEHERDLETDIMKAKSKDQDRLLAIVAGLQEGIEDLLAGRVFHPKEEEEEEEEDTRPRSRSSGSNSDRQDEIPSPEETKQDTKTKEAAQDKEPVALKKSLAGMPLWAEHEVQSEDEDSNALSAGEGESDNESVGSFLRVAQHDIDDLVQETDERKLQQQVGYGRAATNRIMYEWKEYARVKLMEEVNQWFQHRSWAAREEAELLDETEAASREILASEHESIRALKTAIERKEIALVSSVSSFRQNMDRRIEQHWAAKRRARDQAIAQVQREEEQRRQERLRRQQERAAKKFSDIDDQIADIKDNIEQVKGEIHKKELMKHSYPSGKRRASAAGAAKAGDVLAIIAAQQEEAQVLSGKLALANQKLEAIEEAFEKGKSFFNSQAFKSKKIRSLPADDPAGELVNEEMTSAMKNVLAQLMIEDESLAELISIAISLANSPSGKNRTRNGFLRLDDIFGEKDPLGADDPNKLPSDEIVVSKDPEERKRKLKEIQAECAQLQEDIEILDGVDHIMPDSPASPFQEDETEEQQDDGEEAKARKAKEKALKKLLIKAKAAMEAMRQKKAVLTQSRKHKVDENAEVPAVQGPSVPKQEFSALKEESNLSKPPEKDQSELATTPTSRLQQQPEPVSPTSPITSPSSGGSPSRASKSRKSLAARRGSVGQEETEEQKEQKSALKLKDLVSACQQLAEEKEGYEKEMASIEEKIRRVKIMDSGGVVELLKKDVQSEKKVDSAEVKELKAEIKKKQSQVNAMRRTWQDMQLSGNRRNALSGAEEEERQRDVAKRFAHVLSFLRASKATELTQEAKKAGLVTASGNAEVVGRTASKFLSSIRKVRVAERPEQVEVEEGDEVPPSPGGLTPRASPSPAGASPRASKQGFSRVTEANTGQRGQTLGVPQGEPDQDRVQSPRLMPRRASLPLKGPEDDSDDRSRRRRSFNNILEKAKMKKPKDDDVATPGAKVNSAVRFAPEDAQETPTPKSKPRN